MSDKLSKEAQPVLSFWLGELDADGCAAPSIRELWWKKDEAFDAEIRERFGPTHSRLADGVDQSWLDAPRNALAYILLFDQFSRNMFRDSGGMFASDPLALEASKSGIDRGQDRALGIDERVFFYMPFMHSESLDDQNRCIELFERLGGEVPEAHKERIGSNVGFAIRHRDIVERWGRFPHRNALLGRDSTAEEIAFLRQPGSSF